MIENENIYHEEMSIDDWASLGYPEKHYSGFRLSKKGKDIFWLLVPQNRSNTYTAYSTNVNGSIIKKRYGLPANTKVFAVKKGD